MYYNPLFSKLQKRRGMQTLIIYLTFPAISFPKLMQLSTSCADGYQFTRIPSCRTSNPASFSFSVIIFTDSPLQP